MPQHPQAVLDPRKSPVQARSAASVDAILEATIQVLVSMGKEGLTTTKVAARAGVSVGTLYQYYPNKSSLLQAVLKRHLDEVAEAVEQVCRDQACNSLQQMATALITTFFQAKMSDPRASGALYSVSSDVDGAKIALQVRLRSTQAIAAMLATAPERLTKDPQLIALILQGAMAGVSRTLLESGAPARHLAGLRQELIFFACAYVEACASKATTAHRFSVRVQERVD